MRQPFYQAKTEELVEAFLLHPNGMAGTLTLVILDMPATVWHLSHRSEGYNRQGIFLRTGLTLRALASALVTLLLTQSREALLRFAAASVVLFFARYV